MLVVVVVDVRLYVRRVKGPQEEPTGTADVGTYHRHAGTIDQGATKSRGISTEFCLRVVVFSRGILYFVDFCTYVRYHI